MSHLFGLYFTSNYEGIPVWHTAINKRGTGNRSRLIGFIMYNIIGFFIGLLRLQKVDVILVVSPLLTSGITGWFLKVLKKANLIYNVQELYPDTEIGILRRDSLMALCARVSETTEDMKSLIWKTSYTSEVNKDERSVNI